MRRSTSRLGALADPMIPDDSYWAERLADAVCKMAAAQSPNIRQMHAKLAEHYLSMVKWSEARRRHFIHALADEALPLGVIEDGSKQIGECPAIQPVHRPRPVHFDSSHAQVELMGNNLVRLAFGESDDDLTLSRCQVG